jgi:hypothetical protein
MLKTSRSFQRLFSLTGSSTLSTSSCERINHLYHYHYHNNNYFSTSILKTDNDTSINTFDLYNPTEEHQSLRLMLRDFVEKEVDPQALQYNREEKFNIELFRKLGTYSMYVIVITVRFLIHHLVVK